jgi:peptide deformylase
MGQELVPVKELRILAFPDPFLFLRAREVLVEELALGHADDVDLRELVGDMLATMYLNCGAGLAAPQVGVGLRLFVADTSPRVNSPFHVFNPVISEPRGGMETDLEGCLSVPGTRMEVERSRSVLVTGMYLGGKLAEFRANGTMARVCQHEADHLDGVLIVPRGSSTTVP